MIVMPKNAGAEESEMSARHNGSVMPTDVRYLVEADEPYTLVRLVGLLDAPAAESVRGTLLTCLADQAAAVVVDASELRVVETAALSVFEGVSREAAEWAAGQLIFCVPNSRPEDGWEAAGVAVSTSRQAALARLGALAGAARPQRYAELAPVVGAARRARDLVTEGCAGWGVPGMADPATVAVTEMVNNVVVHAGTSMTVRLALWDGALRIAVRDYSRQKPTFSGSVPPPTSAGGRGLLLIDTVARRWGTSLLDDGKIVWAVLHPDDAPVD